MLKTADVTSRAQMVAGSSSSMAVCTSSAGRRGSAARMSSISTGPRIRSVTQVRCHAGAGVMQVPERASVRRPDAGEAPEGLFGPDAIIDRLLVDPILSYSFFIVFFFLSFIPRQPF